MSTRWDIFVPRLPGVLRLDAALHSIGKRFSEFQDQFVMRASSEGDFNGPLIWLSHDALEAKYSNEWRAASSRSTPGTSGICCLVRGLRLMQLQPAGAADPIEANGQE